MSFINDLHKTWRQCAQECEYSLPKALLEFYGEELRFMGIGVGAQYLYAPNDVSAYVMFATGDSKLPMIPLRGEDLAELKRALLRLPQDFPNRDLVFRNISKQLEEIEPNFQSAKSILNERKANYRRSLFAGAGASSIISRRALT